MRVSELIEKLQRVSPHSIVKIVPAYVWLRGFEDAIELQDDDAHEAREVVNKGGVVVIRGA